MSNDQVVNELKEKKLPTFGTIYERKDRLKRHHGIIVSGANDSTLKDGTNNISGTGANPPLVKKNSCLEEIERLKV